MFAICKIKLSKTLKIKKTANKIKQKVNKSLKPRFSNKKQTTLFIKLLFSELRLSRIDEVKGTIKEIETISNNIVKIVNNKMIIANNLNLNENKFANLTIFAYIKNLISKIYKVS